jgi:uncharacterized protein YhaN
MIIERLDLIAFGQFTNAELDLSAGPNRFHMVYGPNESGKSTSMRAIHSLLFGIPQRSDDNFIHAYNSMRIGGQFRDAATGEVIQCVRKRGKAKTLLTRDESAEVDPARLAAMLRGVDSETFTRQFGLSHQELVAGGRAIINGGGDLGEMLFAAGTGTGTLRAARAQLEKDRRELFIERGSTGTINKLIARFIATDKELRDLRLLPAYYDQKHSDLDQTIRDADHLEEDLRSQAQANRLLKAYAEAQSLLPVRQSILEQLSTPIGTTPLLDDDFIANRRKLETNRHAIAHELKTLQDQLSELTSRHDQLSVDQQWLDVVPTIKSLMNELSEIIAGRKQADRHQDEITDADRKISTAVARLGKMVSWGAANDDDMGLLTRIDPLEISETIRNEITSLVTRYGGLNESTQTAQDTIHSLEQARGEMAAKLEQLPDAPNIAPLVDVLADIGKPRLLIDVVAKCRDEEQKTLRSVKESLAALRGFSASIDDARHFLPPPQAKITELADSIARAKSELQKRQSALAAEQEKHIQARAVYEELVCDTNLPTTQQRDLARQDRDQTIERLQALITNREPIELNIVLKLEKQIQLADQVTDRLHQAYDQVTQQQRLANEVTKSQRQVDSATQAERVAQQSLDDALTQWRQLWMASNVDAGTPDEMQLWLTGLQSLKSLIATWDDKVAAVASAEAAVERAAEQLLATIRIFDTTPTERTVQKSKFDLIEAHSLAIWQREEVARLANERKLCEDELNRIDKALSKANEDLRKQKRNWQTWQDHWAELLTKIAINASVQPENIHAIIREVDEVQNLRLQQDSIAASLRSLQSNLQDYQSRVQAVADHLKLDFDPSQLPDFVRRLDRQADACLKQKNERDVLAQQVDALRQKIRSASENEQSLLAKLRSLCAEAGTDDIQALPAIEQASVKRRELERDLATIDKQLRALAAPQSLAPFLQQAALQDASALAIEVEKSESQLRLLQQRWADAQQQVGKLRGEVEQMDASDQAAAVQQERQNLLAAIRRHASRYAELTIAEDALKRSIEHYRQENEGPVLRLASRFFQQLTGGEYECLQIEFDDKDQPKLMGVRPNSRTTVMANLMSDGTADALYLSLRLASLEVHLDAYNPIPLIVDDCLVQFDDDRASAALRILSEMSLRTQVILFTHHQHLLDLASENIAPGGFHIHRLDKQFVHQAIGRDSP